MLLFESASEKCYLCRHARQWRMPVVTAAWVEAVAKMEVFEPVESRYLVPEPRRIARLSQPDAT